MGGMPPGMMGMDPSEMMEMMGQMGMDDSPPSGKGKKGKKGGSKKGKSNSSEEQEMASMMAAMGMGGGQRGMMFDDYSDDDDSDGDGMSEADMLRMMMPGNLPPGMAGMDMEDLMAMGMPPGMDPEELMAMLGGMGDGIPGMNGGPKKKGTKKKNTTNVPKAPSRFVNKAAGENKKPSNTPPASSSSSSKAKLGEPYTSIDEINVGDAVFVRNDASLGGVVVWLGSVDYAKGDWVGVELDQPSGKNNGTVKGKTYFSCKDQHGLIVRASETSPAL